MQAAEASNHQKHFRVPKLAFNFCIVAALLLATLSFCGTAGAQGAVVYLPAPGALTSYKVTGATNASPIVFTVSGSAPAVGAALACQDPAGQGASGNTNAFGYFQVTSSSGSTFQAETLYYNSAVNGNGSWSGPETCYALAAYTMGSHPRALMDGLSGTVSTSLTQTCSTCKVNTSNPPYAALNDEVISSSSWHSNYTSAGVDSVPNYMFRYAGSAFAYWANNSDSTDLTIAKYGVDNVEQIFNNSSYNSSGATFNCSSGDSCPNADVSLVMDYGNYSILPINQAYSILKGKGQLSATEISNYAGKMLNDNTLAHNGIGGISGASGTACTNWAAQAAWSGTSSNQCGFIWMMMHAAYSPTSAPGEEGSIYNDYPNGGGISNTSFTNGYVNYNLDLAQLLGFIDTCAVLADDDVRAQYCLTKNVWFWYYFHWRFEESAATSFNSLGGRYYVYRKVFNDEIALILKNSGGPDYSSGVWLNRNLEYALYMTLPDNPGPGQMDIYANPGTNSNNGDQADPAVMIAPTLGLFPTDPYAPYARYWVNNIIGVYTKTLLGEQSGNGYLTATFMPYLYIDPGATQTNPSGNLSTQWLFNDTDQAKAVTAFGSAAYPNIPYAVTISKSDWGSSATQLVFQSGYNSNDLNHAGCGAPGAIHIERKGYLVAGNGSSSSAAEQYAQGNAHTGGDCGGAASDSMLQIGSSATTDSWASTNSITGSDSSLTPTIDRWASTDPTGDSSSRYMYVMGNLTNAFASSANVSRADRHIIHFKEGAPSSQDYIVVYDDVALSSGTNTIRGIWGLFTNGNSGTKTVSFSAPTASVTGQGSKLNMSVLTVGAANSVAFTNGTQTGNWHPTYACSSTTGTACAAASSFEEAVVLEPMASTTGSLPTISQPTCNGTGGNCAVVDIQDSSAPKVAVFGRQGALLTGVSFASTHSGTAQYLIAGLSPGTYTITAPSPSTTTCTVVTGDNTCYFESTAGSVSVSQGPAQPDFSVGIGPSSQTVTAGSSTTYTTTIGALAGFTGSVALTASGLPTGASGSFAPASVTTSGSSTLTITTATATVAGTYTVTITGTSGSTQHSATVSLVVNAAPVAGFSVSSGPSSQTVSAGTSTTYTETIGALNGFTGSVTFAVAGLPTGASGAFSPTSVTTSGSSTLTVTTTTGTATGSYALTITGTSGSTQHTATATLVITAAAGSPTISSFTPVPTSITSGSSSTLAWATTGATSIAITPGTFTSTSASGSTSVSPTATTTYTLTATNSSGSNTAMATVTVGLSNPCSVMSTGVGASLNGFVPFPASNPWNQNIASAAVDPNSASIINYIGTTTPLHPDFGSGSTEGIPYIVVDSSVNPLVNITLTDSSESDLMPMPFTTNAPIEAGSDHHVLVLDRNACWAYEVWEGALNGTTWSANNSAVWDLQNYNNRPYTWTSADAAGLSVFAGLVRYDEASSGTINHAIRFTIPNSFASFVDPATHWAATASGSPIPMGMQIRLKASVDISGYSAINQTILTAMKNYGLIVADNGSAMYVSGAPDSRWSDDDLHNLTNLTASDFEVVQMPTEITQNNVPTGTAPAISTFTASANNVTAGTAVTLSWDATNVSYAFINPSVGTQVGTVRGTSVVVNPTATTTYTLYVTNSYGQATHNVTVTVTAGQPDFLLLAGPAAQTITVGGSTTYTATVTALSGFTGTVNLAVSGLPSGATGTFSPTSISTSGTSTLTVNTTSGTAAGSYTLTLTGTSGSTQHTATATLVINAVQPPDFSLGASPSSQTVTAGGSTTYTATVGALSGFTGTVALTASGLPSGATASFSPTSITTLGSSTLTVTTTSSTPAGTSTLTITGTSGSTQHTATTTLVVNAAPNFSLAATPSTQTVTAGGSTTYTATVGALSGFTGTVALTASGLPSGATASFSPASITTSGSSTLTVTTTSSTPAGTSTLTITGTSGSTVHTATTSLVVNAASQPDFSIAATPSTQTVTAGGSTTYTATVGALSGFTGTVALTASGLPSGATASFSPASITTSGSSTLTVTTTSSTPAGTSTLTITGTSGSTQHTATTSLVVNAASQPDFSMAATPSTQTVTAGGSTTYTATVGALSGFTGTVALTASGLPSGATASFSPASITTLGSSTLTVTTTSSTPAGTSTLTITGTSGSTQHTATTTLVVNAAPNFSLAATPSTQTVTAGGSTTYTATVGALSGFTGTVTLTASGLPSGATASFSPTSITTSGLSTLTVTTTSSTAAGTYTVTITGTSGSTQHTATTSLVVNAASQPDFSISATPNTQTVTAGGSTTYTTTIGALSGFTGTVALTASGLPSGATPAFSPTSITTSGTSTLTVTTTSSTAAGTYTVTLTGTSGSTVHTTTISLVVNVPQTIALSSSVTSAQITAGGSATFTISVTSTGGFSGVVSLTTSGQPSGVTASYSPTTVTGSGATLLTISSQSTVAPGTYTINATGTSGSLTSSLPLSLTINAASSNVTVSTNPTSATVDPGSSTQFSVTIAGATAISSPAFTCAGLPSYATCQFTNPTIAGNGLSASTTLTLTISDQGSSVQHRSRLTAALVGSTTFGFIGLVFAGMGGRRRRAAGLLIAGAVMCLAFGGCVGYSGTPNSETSTGGSGTGPVSFSFSVNGSAQEGGATVSSATSINVTVND